MQQHFWERKGIKEWHEELKIKEIAVSEREKLVSRREQEYYQIERCPLCEKRKKM